ncbi:MAG: NAD(P)-dependent oxidoreductase [Candidatus Omnitrophota bacterium]
MKIVVFGGSGFLGSHVVDVLIEKGHDVTIFDLKPSVYTKKGTMAVADILDEKAVDSAVRGADAVYNFAGIADIDEAKANPVLTVKQNIVGNAVILEACRKNKVGRFLFASSIYVYSNSGSFYRSTKHACELIIEDYGKAYGLDFTILRYGSLYGPRADGRNWIHSMLKQAVTEGKITRKGDGEEIREYIHVRDAARMSVDALEKQYANQYVVITGNQAIKMKDLLVMIKEMMNNSVKIEYIPARDEEHYEITPYSFNPRIARRITAPSYLDLGQGMLDALETVYHESSPHSKGERLRVK